MRRTQTLLQQHAGRLFVAKWRIQGKRVVRETPALSVLRDAGVQIEDPLSLISNKPAEKPKKFEVRGGWKEKEVVHDSTHPDYHEEPCLVYKDGNVLVEGLNQAKTLTNTCSLSHDIPESLNRLAGSRRVPLQDQLVQRALKASLMYDAYQEKLPKRHDPEREAWVFPRYYGITDRRRNVLLCNRLLQLCSMFDPDLCLKRRLTPNAAFKVPLQSHGSQLLLDLRADVLISSVCGIRPLAKFDEAQGGELPDLSPLLPIVSIQPDRIYKLEDVFPLSSSSGFSQVHTAIVHYNETEVSNLYETEVTESQILGRSLLKAFTFAMAQARNLHGNVAKDLEKPVVVQCIHTDSCFFHFSIFQLNSMNLESSQRNIYWSFPLMRLYTTCEYVDGQPKLEGFNPDVFKWLFAFYRNS